MSGVIMLVLRIAIAAALYIFLAGVLWVLWRDLRARGGEELLSPASVAPDALELVDLQSGERHLFSRSQLVIGRDPTNDLRTGDSTVSARHARLSFHHGQWWAQDLDSRNGTFLNGEPLSEPLALADGDELRCGAVVYQVRLGLDEGESPDPAYNGTS